MLLIIQEPTILELAQCQVGWVSKNRLLHKQDHRKQEKEGTRRLREHPFFIVVIICPVKFKQHTFSYQNNNLRKTSCCFVANLISPTFYNPCIVQSYSSMLFVWIYDGFLNIVNHTQFMKVIFECVCVCVCSDSYPQCVSDGLGNTGWLCWNTNCSSQ